MACLLGRFFKPKSGFSVNCRPCVQKWLDCTVFISLWHLRRPYDTVRLDQHLTGQERKAPQRVAGSRGRGGGGGLGRVSLNPRNEERT